MSKLDNKPLVWLWTHCSAIGMDCKSESGELEHDIALFTIKQQERIAELERKLFDAEKAMSCKFDKDGHTYYADDKTIARMIDTERSLAAAQATIQQMREYIEKAPHRPVCYRLDIYDERDHGCTCGREKLLALPADRSCLDAMLAEARNEQREKDAKICDKYGGTLVAEEIRQAAERSADNAVAQGREPQAKRPAGAEG